MRGGAASVAVAVLHTLGTVVSTSPVRLTLGWVKSVWQRGGSRRWHKLTNSAEKTKMITARGPSQSSGNPWTTGGTEKDIARARGHIVRHAISGNLAKNTALGRHEGNGEDKTASFGNPKTPNHRSADKMALKQEQSLK